MSFRTEEALIALRQISRATASDSRKLAKESGLAVSQLLTLQEISRAGAISPSRLAEQVSLSRGTMTIMLRKLEALGMISRAADQHDKRSYFVTLSEKGSAALAGAPTLLHEVFSSRFARLENWEQAQIISALERVAMMLEADAIEAAPILDASEELGSLPPINI
tara:strand:+ start:110 stop:604 length:495 start_codon:yes stop_codon:yes gene_type:complete